MNLEHHRRRTGGWLALAIVCASLLVLAAFVIVRAHPSYSALIKIDSNGTTRLGPLPLRNTNIRDAAFTVLSHLNSRSTVSVSGTSARACRLGGILDPIHAIVLALVQGLSEFLPISSSGHLVLVPYLFGWEDQGLAFDVAVHVGTLFAVIAYFRRELIAMTRAFFGSLTGSGLTPDARLAWCVLLGTIPVGIAGLAFGSVIEETLRNPVAVGTTLSVFGALMWLADRFGRRERDEYSVSWRDAILIGLSQALALMPGTSRSGVTMTMARTLGLTREGAARFSFLLAVPGIAMAGAYEGLKVAMDENHAVDWPVVALGVAVAAVTGYLCIAWLLRVINRIGLGPFAIYRFLVAGLLFWIYA